jgi:hypothetical protein
VLRSENTARTQREQRRATLTLHFPKDAPLLPPWYLSSRVLAICYIYHSLCLDCCVDSAAYHPLDSSRTREWHIPRALFHIVSWNAALSSLVSVATMPPSRFSQEDRRLLSSNVSSNGDGDAYDKEALTDLETPKSQRSKLGNLLCWSCFSVSGCARAMFRASGWLIVLAAVAILLESYSLGLLWAPSTSVDDPQPANSSAVLSVPPVSIDDSTPDSIHPLPASIRYTKPAGPKIIGLVFYGRRDRAVILDCYLKQNLVVNGGWLDEVIWGVNTRDEDDLIYLEELIPSSRYYRQLDLDDGGYVNLWNQSVEYGNVYIKIDDDVVYIHRDTIPQIVHTLVTESKAAAVSANVINSPEHNWVHYRAGAVRPYLPELEPPGFQTLSTLDNPVWKVSDLPSWIGPGGWTSPPVAKFTEEILRLLPPKADDEQSAKLPRHRWLPLEDPLDISKTPIAQTSYDPFGPGWSSWAVAAQEHYSFFHNLEMDRLSTYYLNHGFGEDSSAIWDHTGDRLSINLLAVTGETILDNIDNMAASDSDEAYLTIDLPRQINKRKSPPNLPVCQHAEDCCRPSRSYPSPCQPLCVQNPRRPRQHRCLESISRVRRPGSLSREADFARVEVRSASSA